MPAAMLLWMETARAAGTKPLKIAATSSTVRRSARLHFCQSLIRSRMVLPQRSGHANYARQILYRRKTNKRLGPLAVPLSAAEFAKIPAIDCDVFVEAFGDVVVAVGDEAEAGVD